MKSYGQSASAPLPLSLILELFDFFTCAKVQNRIIMALIGLSTLACKSQFLASQSHCSISSSSLQVSDSPSDHLRPGVMERGAVSADEWLRHGGPDIGRAEAAAPRRQGANHEQPDLWRHPPGAGTPAVCHRGPGIRWVVGEVGRASGEIRRELEAGQDIKFTIRGSAQHAGIEEWNHTSCAFAIAYLRLSSGEKQMGHNLVLTLLIHCLCHPSSCGGLSFVFQNNNYSPVPALQGLGIEQDWCAIKGKKTKQKLKWDAFTRLMFTEDKFNI